MCIQMKKKYVKNPYIYSNGKKVYSKFIRESHGKAFSH